MFNGPGLLVSIPARELGQCALSGSLFKLAELRNAPISYELRSALNMAQQICSRQRIQLLAISRPEIFTHGVSLEWLKDRLNGIEDHLCISDGTAVRPIPQLRNHLFLYRLGNSHNAAAFQRLSRCAPELLATMHSQINTCLSFRVGGRVVRPPSVLLQVDGTKVTRSAPKYFSHVHHASIDTSIERILRAESRFTKKSRHFEQVTYIPMTESASKDKVFARSVAAAIGATYSSQSRCVILRMPRLHTQAAIKDRLKATLEVVRANGLRHPRTALPSVVFVTEDPPSDSLASVSATLDLLMHSSFEFWSYPVDYYAGFRKLEMIGSDATTGNRTALSALLKSALGRDIVVRPGVSRPPGARAVS